jgi:predicted RNA binding protein YcfA (HicA-like mRNA interferase family)
MFVPLAAIATTSTHRGTIPGHPGDDVPTGTLKSIQKAAGLEKKQ